MPLPLLGCVQKPQISEKFAFWLIYLFSIFFTFPTPFFHFFFKFPPLYPPTSRVNATFNTKVLRKVKFTVPRCQNDFQSFLYTILYANESLLIFHSVYISCIISLCVLFTAAGTIIQVIIWPAIRIRVEIHLNQPVRKVLIQSHTKTNCTRTAQMCRKTTSQKETGSGDKKETVNTHKEL